MTHLLVDNAQDPHVVGILLGRPWDVRGWGFVHNDALAVLKDAASHMTFTSKEMLHRRGSFPAIAHGLSFGGGQTVHSHAVLPLHPLTLCRSHGT